MRGARGSRASTGDSEQYVIRGTGYEVEGTPNSALESKGIPNNGGAWRRATATDQRGGARKNRENAENGSPGRAARAAVSFLAIHKPKKRRSLGSASNLSRAKRLLGPPALPPRAPRGISCSRDPQIPQPPDYRLLSNPSAIPSTFASSPGSPTNDTIIAGTPSAPDPAGTDTSGRPSQLPYPSGVRTSGHGSAARGALNGIVGYTIAATRAARIDSASFATTSARERANERPAGSSVIGRWSSGSHSSNVAGSTS